MGTPATVGIDNNLTASQTGVTLRTTNNKEARGLNIVDSLVVEVLSGDDLNNLLLNLLTELLGSDILGVLNRNDNGIDTLENNDATVFGILNSDLGLSIRAEPGESRHSERQP